ncbi:MAG: hypothetical protein Q9173_001969 [Seirophora scorigena]
MSKQVRGFVSRRISLVGLHLQVFWQKTLTSGHSLKQALSPHSSPRSATFPSANSNDGPSHLPVFSTTASGSAISALEPHSRSGTCFPIQIIAAENATRTATNNRETQTEDSQSSSASHSIPANHDSAPYADAAAQTDTLSPRTDQATLVGDRESDSQESRSNGDRRERLWGDESPTANPGTEPEDFAFTEDSKVVVADYKGEKHRAFLVTGEMIRNLNRMANFEAKLNRIAGNLEAAKVKVELAKINIRHYESAIEETESPKKIEEYQEELAKRRSTLPADEKRRDDLQEHADLFKIHMDNSARWSLDELRTALTDAGLLQTQFEKSRFEPGDESENDEEGASDHDEASQFEQTYYDDRTVSSVSEISLDELHRRTVYEEVRQKYRNYYEAENQFDNRHQQYAIQKARWEQMVHDGECSMAQTEFDHCDFEVTQELANDMAAAEEAYEEALARRNKLGLGGSDQESGFPMDEYEGYPLSWENEGIASAPRPFIEDWLEEIPEVENLPNMADLSTIGGHEFGQEEPEEEQDWEIQSAQMSDTWSCRDLTRNRKRIDRWNEITGRKK